MPPNKRCVVYIASDNANERTNQRECCQQAFERLQGITDVQVMVEDPANCILTWPRRPELKVAIKAAVGAYLLIGEPAAIAPPQSVSYSLFVTTALANRTTLISCNELSELGSFSQGLTPFDVLIATETYHASIENEVEALRDIAELNEPHVEIPDHRFLEEVRNQLIGCLEYGDVESVNKLAKEIGISQPTLYRFVHQGSTPQSRTLEKLLQYVNTKIRY